jgi:mxaA protein
VGNAARDAMLELHRAFDATAGRRVLAADIDGFIEQHKRFGGLKQDIETFFAASRTFFFGPVQDAALPLDRLAALGRRLMRAERAS